MGDQVPIVRGGHGLTGRGILHDGRASVEEQVGEDGDVGVVVPETVARSKAIPGGCRRRLSLPESSPRNLCEPLCPGAQPDGGGCLADVVRRAQAQGVDWSFEVRTVDENGTQRWTYDGPPLA